MADLHIDDFFRDSAKILVALYAQFPKPILLCVEDICGPDTPDDFGLPSPRHLACFQTMVWLANTGYLNFAQTVRQEALDQAVLSHSGFIRLHAQLPPSEPTEPVSPETTVIEPSLVIHNIRSSLRNASSSKINQTLYHLLFFTAPLFKSEPVK